jgi:hypothetical protein
VFSQFLLSDGTPLIASKSVCQQPVSADQALDGMGCVCSGGIK